MNIDKIGDYLAIIRKAETLNKAIQECDEVYNDLSNTDDYGCYNVTLHFDIHRQFKILSPKNKSRVSMNNDIVGIKVAEELKTLLPLLMLKVKTDLEKDLDQLSFEREERVLNSAGATSGMTIKQLRELLNYTDLPDDTKVYAGEDLPENKHYPYGNAWDSYEVKEAHIRDDEFVQDIYLIITPYDD